MCIGMSPKIDNSAQQEALRLQRIEAMRTRRAEMDALGRDKAETLNERKREAEGRQMQSMALFAATPSMQLAGRSLFLPTGG